MTDLVRRTGTVLHADPSACLARLFVPGNELTAERASRAGGVVGRVLDLPEEEVARLAADVRARWGPRHRDLDAVLDISWSQVAHRVPDPISDDRRAVLSSYFTQEQSFEAAALFNPSLVPHPDQAGVPDGSLRVVMSLRAVGEGHVRASSSAPGWWTPPASWPSTTRIPTPRWARCHRACGTVRCSRAGLERAGTDDEAAAFLVALLPERFGGDELDVALVGLHASQHFRRTGPATDAAARRLAASTYEVRFPT